MAYHTATKPTPRYPEHYLSQGKLVTSLSVALGIYTALHERQELRALVRAAIKHRAQSA